MSHGMGRREGRSDLSPELKHRLFEYWWEFGEDLPYLDDFTEEEALATIDRCLREKKRYDPYEGIDLDGPDWIVY